MQKKIAADKITFHMFTTPVLDINKSNLHLVVLLKFNTNKGVYDRQMDKIILEQMLVGERYLRPKF